MAARTRLAARVVLVDPTGAFLMIKARDSSLAAGPTWWHVPGGGLDEGETPEQAAIREIREEVGTVLADVGPRRASWSFEFTFEGQHFVQHETFYMVPLPERVEVVDTAWTEVERRSTLAWRWWTFEELVSTEETVYPGDLPRWLVEWGVGPVWHSPLR